MRKILLFLCLLSIPTAALATTIIVARTPEFIIIATDSKATYFGRPGPPSVCKIYRTGGLYFAVAGLDRDSARNFSVQDIIARNVSPLGNFDSEVARVEEVISASLMNELSKLRIEDPANYGFITRLGSDVVSVVFAEWQDGVPHMAARTFTWDPAPSPSIRISRVTCPGSCSPDGRELISFGERSSAAKFMHENSGEDFDLPSLATKLVQLEVDSSPTDVGPPIVELQLDKDGANWIANGSGCPVGVP